MKVEKQIKVSNEDVESLLFFYRNSMYFVHGDDLDEYTRDIIDENENNIERQLKKMIEEAYSLGFYEGKNSVDVGGS